MRTSLLCLFVLSALLAVICADRGGRGKGRGRNAGCSEWVMGECVPKTGDCGRGTKNGTRTGDECALKERTFKCRKPCAGSRPAVKCTFGAWSPYGECQNGMKTKTREIVSGGDACQSRTSKTRPCRN